MTALAVTAEDDRGFELMSRLRALRQAETRQAATVETATTGLAEVRKEREEVERLLAEHIGFVKPPAPVARPIVTRNRKSPLTDALMAALAERKTASLIQLTTATKSDPRSISSMLCQLISAGKVVRIGRGIYQAVAQ